MTMGGICPSCGKSYGYMYMHHCSGRCYPHPIEAVKRGGLAEHEAQIKGMKPGEHPGWKMWLCKRCGTWHEGEPPNE